MKMNKNGYLILASAIVWGAVLIGCSIVLKGTPYKEKINLLLIGGLLFHLFIIWVPLGNQSRKNNKENLEKEK